MTELTAAEQKCVKQSLEFIKATAEKYSLRRTFEIVGVSDETLASQVLIGNIAYDRYKGCVAGAKAPPRR